MEEVEKVEADVMVGIDDGLAPTNGAPSETVRLSAAEEPVAIGSGHVGRSQASTEQQPVKPLALQTYH